MCYAVPSMEIDTNILHDNFFELIESTARKFYFEVLSGQAVPAPVLNMALINISRQGWDHLRLGEKQRSKLDLISRYFALPKIIFVLIDSDVEITHRIEQKAEFWSFSSIVDGVKIKVVVRSVGGGSKHFYSVIWQGEQKKPVPGQLDNQASFNGVVSRLFPRRRGLATPQLQQKYSRFVDGLSNFVAEEMKRLAKFM